MPKMYLDNEFAQFALLTVVLVDQSLFTVTIIEHATHNAIWNTPELSNSKHFSRHFLKYAYFRRPKGTARINKLIYFIYANA
jgi:hypothetical protein